MLTASLLNIILEELTRVVHQFSDYHWISWIFIFGCASLSIGYAAKAIFLLEDFDIYDQIRREGTRRKIIIEPIISHSFKDAEEKRKAIQLRVHETKTPSKAIEKWIKDYRTMGDIGLQPVHWVGLWDALTKDQKKLILARYADLGELADAEYIKVAEIQELARNNNWTGAKTKDLLRRYRNSGLMGLSPQRSKNPKKKRVRKYKSLGALTPADLDYVDRRKQLLGDLAYKEKITNQEAEDQGNRVGLSPRAIRYIWRDYRDGGLAALLKDERDDKGKSHSISEQIEDFIREIRVSLYRPSIQKIYDEVKKRAEINDERPPSKRKIRAVIKTIPEDLLLIADRRYDEFRNKYRFTHTLIIGKRKIILQFDATQIDILAIDKRDIETRAKSGEIRPWLVTVIEANSRALLAAKFSYDVPNKYMVATALYEAVKTTEKKWYGGYPDEIWVDRGKQFTAKLIKEISLELRAIFNKLKPHQPQIKGVCEAFFNTLNLRLWMDLEGYVDSNPQKRNPNAKAKYTIDELEKKFWEFIKQKYHIEEHSETGETPLAYWKNHMYIDPVPDEILSVLLMERAYPICQKGYVSYKGEKYWATDFYNSPGKQVMVKAGFSYGPPNYLEAFTFEGNYICTAYPDNSPCGPEVTPEDIANGQRMQRQELREEVAANRKSLHDFDQEHGLRLTDGDGSTPPVPPSDSSISPSPSRKPRTSPQNKPKQGSSNPAGEEDLISLRVQKLRQSGAGGGSNA